MRYRKGGEGEGEDEGVGVWVYTSATSVCAHMCLWWVYSFIFAVSVTACLLFL